MFTGAGGGDRTHTPLRARDFKSRASASSATPARLILRALPRLQISTARSALAGAIQSGDRRARTPAIEVERPAVPGDRLGHGVGPRTLAAGDGRLEMTCDFADEFDLGCDVHGTCRQTSDGSTIGRRGLRCVLEIVDTAYS